MAKSIKLGADTYLDASGVVMDSSTASRRKTLQEFTQYANTTVAFTAGSVSESITIYKKNWTCMMSISIGQSSGTPFSGIKSGDLIATLPEGWRPAIGFEVVGLMRDSALWASANYEPVYIIINTSGEITIRGNEAKMRTMRYFFFGTSFPLGN